eukprot:87891_1
MELLVISLEYRLVLLVLHHHLHLLVRGMMIIVMDLMQAVHVSIAPPFAAGSAYIYENDNNRSWNEVSKLIKRDGGQYQSFGRSVSIAPPFVIIGELSGKAHIYKNDNNGSWNEISKLIANDRSQGHHFGASVSIAPPFALIGGYKAPAYIMTSYESCATIWNEAPDKSKLIQT